MKQLLILSGKGGTGKTTIATAFIKLANAKAYADCDVDAPNLHLLMKPITAVIQTDFIGMEKAEINPEICTNCGICMTHCRFDAIVRNPKTQVDPFACEGCGVCEAVCPVGAVTLKPTKAGDLMLYKSNVLFSTAKLKMGSGTTGKLVTEVKKNLKDKNNPVDLAIIDGSPGIGCPVIASITGVDLILIVAEPSVSGISDLNRIVETARHFQTPMVVCVNKYDTNETYTLEIENYCEANALPYMGRIPFDPEAGNTINKGRSIVEVDCISGRATKEVFEKTMNHFEVRKTDELYFTMS